MLRAFGQLVRQEADQLESVLARRRPRRIDHGWRQRQHHRIVEVQPPGAKRLEHPGQRAERFETAHGDALHRAGFHLELRRLAERVMRGEHRDARLPARDSGRIRGTELRLADDLRKVADMDR